MMILLLLILSSYLIIYIEGSKVEDNNIITCGSAIKINNLISSSDDDNYYYIRSSGISWGSGSGQQIVTVRRGGQEDNNDFYWLIELSTSTTSSLNNQHCISGDPIKCGSVLRLKHINTGKYLHSHKDPSNLSGQQEVTGYDGIDDDDGDDDWVIECNNNYWLMNIPIQLKHNNTNKYLTSSYKYIYNDGNCPGCPIIGDREIACKSISSNNKDTTIQWSVVKGMIISPTTTTQDEEEEEEEQEGDNRISDDEL
mmetsp:Transcript_6149/g.5077  ORF Transcript_6149/g.5077 Transcript_6149/m.5077 type:complete len:254 (+) Transcript_6149:44-805(+)